MHFHDEQVQRKGPDINKYRMHYQTAAARRPSLLILAVSFRPQAGRQYLLFADIPNNKIWKWEVSQRCVCERRRNYPVDRDLVSPLASSAEVQTRRGTVVQRVGIPSLFKVKVSVKSPACTIQILLGGVAPPRKARERSLPH